MHLAQTREEQGEKRKAKERHEVNEVNGAVENQLKLKRWNRL